MIKDYPDTVLYFYMPTREGKAAELIQILNANETSICVPEREQDITLTAFYSRKMTEKEKSYFGKEQTWRILMSWEEIELDHDRFHVDRDDIKKLLSYKDLLILPEEMAA